MELPKSFNELKEKLSSTKKSIKSIEVGESIYISYDAIRLLFEVGQSQSGEAEIKDFMVFLDLSFSSFSKEKGSSYYLIKLYKENEDSYKIIEGLGKNLSRELPQIDDFQKENKISRDMLNNLLEKLKKEHLIQLPPEDPYKSFSDDLSQRDKILQEYLSNRFLKIAGRKLDDNEQDMYDANLNITVSFEKPKNVSKTKVLQHIYGDLIDSELREQIREAVAIDEILEGVPHYNEKKHIGKFGAVLYGPAGTGKTSIMRSYMDAFREMGAYVDEVDLTKIDDGYKGGPARKLRKTFVEGLKSAKKNSIPSLICVDEGDMLVEKNKNKLDDNYYSGLIRTGKQYIGNKGGLIVIISTNLSKKSFDDALTRGGRLKKVYVPRPKKEKIKEAWKKFIQDDFKLSFNPKPTEEFYDTLTHLIVENEKTYGEMKAFCLDYEGKNNISPEFFIQHFQKMLSTVWASNEDDVTDNEFENLFQNIISQGININTIISMDNFNNEVMRWFISKKSDLKSNSSLSNNRILSIFESIIQVIYYVKNELNYVISNKKITSKLSQEIETDNFLEQVFKYLRENDLDTEELKKYSKESFYILFQESNNEKDITPETEEKVIPNTTKSEFNQKISFAIDYISKNIHLLENIYLGNLTGDDRVSVLNLYQKNLTFIRDNIEDFDKENNVSRGLLFSYEKKYIIPINNIIALLDKMKLKPQITQTQYSLLVSLLNELEF